MISSRLQKYFTEYAISHQNKINIAIHKIAIPLIVFHVFAMLTWVKIYSFSFYTVTLAEFACLVGFAFYVSLNMKYAFIMLLYMALCIVVAHFTPVWCVWLITVVSWFVQLLGHAVWEKKSPAFSKNFLQLLIGPLFVLNKLKV